MANAMIGKGSCLCGAVHVTAQTMDKSVGACHCRMCRQWSGGPLMAIDCGTAVSFAGEDNISIFNSSEWAERGFCKACGSHLFYRLKENQQYFVIAGLFDDDSELILDHQVFIDHKPAFYQFANKTHDMTEAEVFEKFGAAPNEGT